MRAIRLCLLGAMLLASRFCLPLLAQDTISIHFLHGSRPKAAFRGTEPKWFGGKMGGHVGIAWQPDSVFHFIPSGKLHLVGRRAPKHSRFAVSDLGSFWHVFGNSPGLYCTTTFRIPIDSVQDSLLGVVRASYLGRTPYDYAFLGMRCASSTDEILAKLGITRRRGYWGTIFRTFHPKVLRNRLMRLAGYHGWEIAHQVGNVRRSWQK